MFNILLIFILIIGIPFAIAGYSFAPWVPMKSEDLKRIASYINIPKHKIFYDLGSGNGKVAFYLAKKFPSLNVIGVELVHSLFIYSIVKKVFLKQENVSFKMKNFFNLDISNTDVIYLFGTKDTIQKSIIPKFKKELKKGTRIISYAFPLEDWEPLTIDKPNVTDISIYIYEF